jgi:hypothetical protein
MDEAERVAELLLSMAVPEEVTKQSGTDLSS